jgi:hypothetical protein
MEGLKTKNIDVMNATKHIRLFREEVYKSGSADVFNYDAYDLERLETYIARFERVVEFIAASPKLDLPKWHRNEMDVPGYDSNLNVQSANVEYILRVLDAAYFEIAESQSSDLSNGLEVADKGRLDKLIQRLKDWVQAIKDSEQVDMPETAVPSEV